MEKGKIVRNIRKWFPYGFGPLRKGQPTLLNRSRFPGTLLACMLHYIQHEYLSRTWDGYGKRRADDMKSFTVYRIDKAQELKVRVGTLVERRAIDRGNNIAGLLKLAAGTFKSSPDQIIQIDFRGILVEL